MYTFDDQTTFQVSQILLAVPLPVPLVLAVVTLRIFSWASLGLHLSFGLTTALGISSFALLLETGSVHHSKHVAWILLHRCFRSLKHSEQFVCGLVKPIHVVIHDKAVVRRGSDARRMSAPSVAGIANPRSLSLCA